MRVLSKIIIYLLLALALLAIAVTIVFKLPSTRQMAKEYVIGLINEKSDYNLKIDDISLSLPLSAHIPSASIFNAHGKIASIEDLQINIWPSIYLLEEINVTKISANSLKIYKLPENSVNVTDSSLSKTSYESGNSFVGNNNTPNIGIDSMANSDHADSIDYPNQEAIERSFNLIPDIIIHKAKINRIEIFDTEFDIEDISIKDNLSNRTNLNNGTNSDNIIDSMPKASIVLNFKADANLIFSKNHLQINLSSTLLDYKASEDIKIESNLFINSSIDLLENKLLLKTVDFTLVAKDVAGEDLNLKANLNGDIGSSGGELKSVIKLSNSQNRPLLNFYNFPDLSINAKFSNSDNGITGDLFLEQGNFSGSSNLSIKDQIIALTNMDVKSELSSKKVNLSYDMNKRTMLADVKFYSSDISDLKEFLPDIGSGKLSMGCDYKLDFDKEIYRLNLDGNLDDFNYESMHLDQAQVKASITDLVNLEFDILELNSKFINYDGVLISKANFKVRDNKSTNKKSKTRQGDHEGAHEGAHEEGFNKAWLDLGINKSVNIQSDLEIISPYPISLASNNNLTIEKNRVGLEIKKLTGHLNKDEIRLKKPISINLSNELNVSAPSIALGKGEANLELKVHSEDRELTSLSLMRIQGKAGFKNISFNAFGSELSHIFSDSKTKGEISISGFLGEPLIESVIDINNISLISIQGSVDDNSNSNEEDLHQAARSLDKIKAAKRVSKGGLDKFSKDKEIKIDTLITKNKLSSMAYINASNKNIATLKAELPILLDLPNFDFQIYQDKEIDINFKLANKIELLSLIPMPPGHNIRGILEGGLRAGGSLNKIDLSGEMKLFQGKYSYKPLGVRVIDVSSKLVASDQSIKFPNIYMADKFGNKITGTGTLDIDEDFSYEVNLSTDKFALLNSPHLQGSIAGKANLIGDAESSKLSGNLFIGPMEIKIPERIQKDFPELNITQVIEVNEFPGLRLPKNSDHEICFNVNVNTYDNIQHRLDKQQRKPNNNYNNQEILTDELDLSNIVHKRVAVRGWGVDTHLQGGLKITGCSANPLINGKLTSVGGKYSEFGRELDIERGVLKFEGSIPPSPFLDIVGIMKEYDKEFRVSLGGPISSPQINISANPAMPQEEALSMMLFGSNPDNISAFQAVQLASSMRRLSGEGESSDIIGASKKAIGIDELSFRQDPNNPEASSIAIGKQLSDKFYIEVERGVEDETKTKIEVEISPKITIDAFTESTGNSSVGINWKYDY